MKICFDTNVVLDVMLQRAPFVRESALALSLVERIDLGDPSDDSGRPPLQLFSGLLCATTITTAHYIIRRAQGEVVARQSIGRLLQMTDLAHVTRAVFAAALKSTMTDFEDAVLSHAAAQAGASAIITRNVRDFAASPVRAYTPTEWLAIHQSAPVSDNQ